MFSFCYLTIVGLILTLLQLFFLQIPSYQVGSSTSRKYAHVKSRIDQSDPNPAHKLQRSLAELTSDSKKGREINPRFANTRSTSTRPNFYRRKTVDFNDRYPQTPTQKKNPLAEYRLLKSASLDSPFVKPKSKLSSTYPTGRQKTSNLVRMTATATSRFNHPILEEIEEDELGIGATMDSNFDSNVEINAKAFTVTSVAEEDAELIESSTSGICGMEVTSNASETTVVLKHLLALSGKKGSSSSDMAIIEEDEIEEEDYYESQDSPLSASTVDYFALAHLIPRLIVMDENDDLVETVIETARKYSSNQFALENTTAAPKVQIASSPLELIAEDEEGYPSTRL